LANLIKSFNKKNKINLINNLKNSFIKKLYSTYISFLPKKDFTYKIKKNIDHRGEFTEFLNNDNFGQFSFFSILPGKIRGNHYHHTKLEKFVVLNGTVRFKFIDLSTNLKFSLVVKDNKKRSTVVNTIPGCAHNIKNIGRDTAKLIVWSNEVFDKNNADTFNYKLN
jgi:UDP-2-acetamido-2,6-beta-L-arabino-hexul-4-ose reductase